MFFWRRRHGISDEELSAYVDGQLDEAARARLETHIEACAACRETLGELRAVRRALSELPRSAAPRSFALREADVRSQAAPQAVAGLGRAPALLGGVATAAVLVFGVLIGIDVAGEPSGDGSSGAALRTASDYAALEDLDAADAEAGALAPEMRGATAEQRYQADAGTGDEEPPKGDIATGAGVEPPPEATPVPRATSEAEENGRTRLRAAEAAAAAVALVAGGSLALAWWRRRA